MSFDRDAHRYIDAVELADLLRHRFGDEVVAATQEWLASQPPLPRLISSTGAARKFGVPLPHLSRLIEAGRMPKPVPIRDGRDVWMLPEVDEYARAEKRRRAERLREQARRARDRERGKAEREKAKQQTREKTRSRSRSAPEPEAAATS